MSDQDKQVREIMIDVFEFPHVPYWFTIRQVSGILKKSISGGKCLRPLAALVFDEKYNLLGHVEAQDILNAVNTIALSGDPARQDIITAPAADVMIAFGTLSDNPVSSLLNQFKHFVEPEDAVAKAAELMLRNNLPVLPVLENQKKLVGIVRDTEIFEYLSTRFFMA